MATTRTRDELVDRALQKLLRLGAGNAAAAEDQELVDGMVDDVLDELASRHIITLTDDEAIPVGVFDYVAEVLAQKAAGPFGIPDNPQKLIYAEGMLRFISATQGTDEPTVTEFY